MWNLEIAKKLVELQEAGIISGDQYSKIREVLWTPKLIGGGSAEGPAEDRETTQKLSDFKFGAASERELVGVKTELVQVTRLALSYSAIDFCCYDGIRTYKEQAQYVKNGTSKTMESKHLRGLAVDLVPWIGGKPVWDWNGCYEIACAMDKAATELGFANRITWGGAWDRRLSDFGGDVTKYAEAVEAYKKRHPGPDFIDGPHFEWRD